MKKKIYFLLTVVISAVFLLTASASADTGPKPTLKLEFINMRNEVCYGTLLSKDKSTGPASAWNGQEDSIPQYP